MVKLSSNCTGNFKTYGIKTAGSEHRHPGGYRIILILLVLVICGVTVWSVKSHLDRRRALLPSATEPRNDRDIPAMTFSDARQTASENAETEEAIRKFRTQEAVESQTEDMRKLEAQRFKLQRQQYDQALQAFNERKMEQCRNILRDMLEPMASTDELYNPAANLLGRASMTLYKSGADTETNVSYEVKKNDTLSKIAVAFHTSVDAIQKANGMTNTRLSIGQKLKIPQSVWSIQIRRPANKLLLFTNNKLFKIYSVYPGSSISQSLTGTYRIFSKQKNPVWRVDGQTYPTGSPGNILGTRWFALKGTGSSAGTAPGTAIHGTNRPGQPDTTSGAPGYFRMTNTDAVELFDLVPCETIVEIKGSSL